MGPVALVCVAEEAVAAQLCRLTDGAPGALAAPVQKSFHSSARPARWAQLRQCIVVEGWAWAGYKTATRKTKIQVAASGDCSRQAVVVAGGGGAGVAVPLGSAREVSCWSAGCSSACLLMT